MFSLIVTKNKVKIDYKLLLKVKEVKVYKIFIRDLEVMNLSMLIIILIQKEKNIKIVEENIDLET